MDFSSVVSKINSIVWGPAMLIFITGTSIYLMFILGFKPIINLGYALKSVFSSESRHSSDKNGDITPFQSLMTSLAATIGIGNIAGVATAMFMGGAGAVLWMWVAAVFGLATKYSECMLSVKYRIKTLSGQYAGGPMYVLKYGLKNKSLGSSLSVLFAFFAVIASFGIGNMTQSNTVSLALCNTFGLPYWITGILLAVFSLLVIVGGIKSIGRVTEKFVPFMAVFYILGGIACILINYKNLPSGLSIIINDAFSFKAMSGGAGGIIIVNAMRYGIARGIFSNEAGLGSAPIAAAAAKTSSPCRQGYISMTGTFFDTIVICSITALVIASSGVLSPESTLNGVDLTIAAFNTALGKLGGYIVTIGSILFAFSTILGWSYYGEKSLEFFYHKSNSDRIKANRRYTILKLLNMFLGIILISAGTIFITKDILNLLSSNAFQNTTLPDIYTPAGKEFYSSFILLLLGAVFLALGFNKQHNPANMIYRILFCFATFIGATTNLTIIWNIADIMNGLMAVPNLISLILLSNVIYKETKNFQNTIKKKNN